LSDHLNLDLSQFLPPLLLIFAMPAAFNYVQRWVSSLFSEYLMATVRVRSDDDAFAYLKYWVSKQELSKRAMHFIADTGPNGANDDDDGRVPGDEEEQDGEAPEQDPGETPEIHTHAIAQVASFSAT
jgi:BCS1 N terminal